MKYLAIDNQLFIENRRRFVSHMKSGSLAIFNSNDIMPSNADGMMPFRQNNDLFHLSGVDQEESILVIFPEAFDAVHREMLFVKETSPQIAVWEGAKLNKEQATTASGIKSIFWLDQFESVLKTVMYQAKSVYLNSNEHSRATIEVETRDARFNKWLKEHYSLHQIERSAPIMHEIRSVKLPQEIELMQNACKLTKQGVHRVLNTLKPGVMEYEIEAELLHEFVKNRSRGFAYEPIIASGASACVLHYTDNNKACNAGEVVLMDFGAEYANYASDLTRCFPVDGTFTPRQKEVYGAVLRVMKAATKMLVPGTYLTEYHKEVGKMMEGELIQLGLISQTDIKNQNPAWPAYKKYFMHGTSHYIGLDVHDVGSWTLPMQEGNVFTCEPGIYIPEEGLGIRLENDILVTNQGPKDLMADIPLEIEEIESLMN
ncbi:MAG: Xaa-Pro aminopeptidase [Flavobacteriales bacterium]|jgi:Xaa-Pro aminopeptidase